MQRKTCERSTQVWPDFVSWRCMDWRTHLLSMLMLSHSIRFCSYICKGSFASLARLRPKLSALYVEQTSPLWLSQMFSTALVFQINEVQIARYIKTVNSQLEIMGAGEGCSVSNCWRGPLPMSAASKTTSCPKAPGLEIPIGRHFFYAKVWRSAAGPPNPVFHVASNHDTGLQVSDRNSSFSACVGTSPGKAYNLYCTANSALHPASKNLCLESTCACSLSAREVSGYIPQRWFYGLNSILTLACSEVSKKTSYFYNNIEQIVLQTINESWWGPWQQLGREIQYLPPLSYCFQSSPGMSWPKGSYSLQTSLKWANSLNTAPSVRPPTSGISSIIKTPLFLQSAPMLGVLNVGKLNWAHIQSWTHNSRHTTQLQLPWRLRFEFG